MVEMFLINKQFWSKKIWANHWPKEILSKKFIHTILSKKYLSRKNVVKKQQGSKQFRSKSVGPRKFLSIQKVFQKSMKQRCSLKWFWKKKIWYKKILVQKIFFSKRALKVGATLRTRIQAGEGLPTQKLKKIVLKMIRY